MGHKIAICDDHPICRMGIAGAFEGDQEVEATFLAGDIEELERLLREQRVDLVLLDVELPGESGLEALPRLSRYAPILMLSGSDDPEYVRCALQRGAKGYLGKDADATQLVRSAKQAIAGIYTCQT